MPATKTPRTGRPRTKAGEYDAMMFRFPKAFSQQLREMAADEERSINTVVYRLLRAALRSEGKQVAASDVSIDTAYSSS